MPENVSEDQFDSQHVGAVSELYKNAPQDEQYRAGNFDISNMMIHGFINRYREVAHQAVLGEKARLEALLSDPASEGMTDDIHSRLTQISETLKHYETEE